MGERLMLRGFGPGQAATSSTVSHIIAAMGSWSVYLVSPELIELLDASCNQYPERESNPRLKTENLTY